MDVFSCKIVFFIKQGKLTTALVFIFMHSQLCVDGSMM